MSTSQDSKKLNQSIIFYDFSFKTTNIKLILNSKIREKITQSELIFLSL